MKYTNYKYEVPKPGNVFRIAAVGDSFTYPLKMQFDDVYSKRLERMLNLGNTGAGTLKAEVINYGQAGLATAQEVGLVSKALQEQADVVVLEVTLNDPAHQTMQQITALSKRENTNYTFGELEISRTKTPLLYYVKTFGFIASRWHNRLSQESVIRYHRDLFNKPFYWDGFASSVISIKEAVASHNAKLVVMIMPMFNYSFDNTYPFADVHKKISSFLTEQGISYLDMLDAYAGIPNIRLELLLRSDGHPNEIAHRIAAENLYSFHEGGDLLPKDLVIANQLVFRFPRIVRYQRNKPQSLGS